MRPEKAEEAEIMPVFSRAHITVPVEHGSADNCPNFKVSAQR
jgi:hypothetical protein